MNASNIILLSNSGSIAEAPSFRSVSVIGEVREKASSLIFPASELSVPKGYESRGSILVRSGGLIAVATEADVARYSR